MAKKSKKVVKTNRHTSPRIAFHLPEALLKRLDAYRNSIEPMPSESAVCRTAIKRFLDEVAPEEDDDESES